MRIVRPLFSIAIFIPPVFNDMIIPFLFLNIFVIFSLYCQLKSSFLMKVFEIVYLANQKLSLHLFYLVSPFLFVDEDSHTKIFTFKLSLTL